MKVDLRTNPDFDTFLAEQGHAAADAAHRVAYQLLYGPAFDAWVKQRRQQQQQQRIADSLEPIKRAIEQGDLLDSLPTTGAPQ